MNIGDYGNVLIKKGKYKDQIGFYDDDDGDYAIVYLGEPFFSDYKLIKHEYLERTELPNIHVQKFKKRCEDNGIDSREFGIDNDQ